MKFTETELVWIKIVMEEKYEEWADIRNEELKEKLYEDAEVTRRHMNIMEDIVEKIREELGI